MPSACLNMREIGFRLDSPGGMGEYMVVEEQYVHAVPDDWSYEDAAWVETFSSGYFGIWDESDGTFTVADGFLPADVNEDGVVDVLDLLAVIAAWGNPGGPADVNEDGIVDVLDLLAVIAAWS